MVVIIGAGIVGAATAYYLSTAPGQTPITVLDAAGPAAGSSGRAGAFLTDQPPAFRRRIGKKTNTVNDKRRVLFEKSFELHQYLAKELKLESFCRVQNYQAVETKETESSIDKESISDDKQQTTLKKIAENGNGEQLPGNAALVDPAELVSAMMDRVLSKSNCSFRQASVSGFEIDPSECRATAIHFESNGKTGSPKTIEIEEEETVVIALGPWSSRIEDWLGIPMPIEGVLSTSLVYQDGIEASDIGSALFFDEDSNGCHLEVFGRRDRSLYVSGCGESEVVSTRLLRSKERPSPTEPCAPDLARAAAAKDSLHRYGYHQRANNITTGSTCNRHHHQLPDMIQACIRPMSPDGVPVVGKLLDNVYVATGGGPWGITWGPLMGKSLASLINDDGDAPIRLGSLSPKRFDTMVYRSLQKSRSSEDR
mmetsp:Transcript_3622/g.7917  ORF Transcript_3622/g.7917 Transcript_3622/m.7917 type:complete len:425 (-) Transcript_3622:391-1665(-)